LLNRKNKASRIGKQIFDLGLFIPFHNFFPFPSHNALEAQWAQAQTMGKNDTELTKR
jgi:hypothetical protein